MKGPAGVCRAGPQALLHPAPAGNCGPSSREGQAKEGSAAALYAVDKSNVMLVLVT